MVAGPRKIALTYDDGAYVEPVQVTPGASTDGPAGLMGRHVAGKEFLDAYFSHGEWSELVALVNKPASARSIRQLAESHPSGLAKGRSVEVIEERGFHKAFFPEPPARLVHFPNPMDKRYAWARQHGGPSAFALTGLTHTLASTRAVETLCDLITAPFEPYDALICTSHAVAAMVRATTGAYADHLRDRFGGDPGLRVRLETIPLGVNTEKFRPPTPDERAGARKALGVGDEELAVLFVGRLSFHAKVHPYPMYDGVARAARASGRKAHLILAGWVAHPSILKAFQDGARVFAPGVRVTVVDGTRPEYRAAVWHAADIFTSLSDNIQETFGLTITEAMASGLPVVTAGWDGCREQVVDGETGFLAPTFMMQGATAHTTCRLVFGEVNYDHFLGECNQAVTVDPAAASEAFRRLFADEGLRRGMGAAGRRRAIDRFAWPSVIRAYEHLWRGLEAERQAHAAHSEGRRRTYAGPACYPAPEHSFASYPTAMLDDRDRLIAAEDARERLEWFLNLPLTNYAADRRTTDPDILRSVLDAAAVPREIGELGEVLARSRIDHFAARSTLAWMLKYGLLRPDRGEAGPGLEPASSVEVEA